MNRRLEKRNWYHENRERLSALQKVYYKNNRAAIIARSKRWYRKNKKRVLEQAKTRYVLNKCKDSYLEKKNNANAARRLDYQSNREFWLVLYRKRRALNKVRINAARRQTRRLDTAQFGDSYIRYLLSSGTRVPEREWPLELVEAKRAELQLKRKIKELWQNQKT